jgi:hypothetical protein
MIKADGNQFDVDCPDFPDGQQPVGNAGIIREPVLFILTEGMSKRSL